jgi:hypothetical protein
MNDDWRLKITFEDHGLAHGLGEELRGDEIEHELERAYGDRVAVSVDGDEAFFYCGDRAQAERAQALVTRVAREHGWTIETELRRWHPTAEVWEDPDIPLPADDEAAAAEEAHRMAIERRESAEQGFPEYEVVVTLGSRGDAGDLAQKLRDEGLRVVHRWHHVLAGADDEQTARALAARLADEAPGADVTVQTNPLVVYENRPSNPFAFLWGG